MSPISKLSSASEIKAMAPTRWGTAIKVLTNKKAIEDAFRQHRWEMQRKAQDLAGGREQTHIQGKYRLKEQELQNQTSKQANLEYQVLTQAVKIAQENSVPIETPEGQETFNQIYQNLLNAVRQQKGTDGGAGSSAGTGFGPGAGITPGVSGAKSLASGGLPSPMSRMAGNVAGGVLRGVGAAGGIGGVVGGAAAAYKSIRGNSQEGTVTMVTPDGKEWQIPRSKINEAKKRGAKLKKL